MPTPLTDAINALTTYANTVTGASDTTLSDAVATLANGYGGGGGFSVDDIVSRNITGDIVYSGSHTYLTDGLFTYTAIDSFTSSTITGAERGIRAFFYCNNLKSISMPNLAIGNNTAKLMEMCYRCTNLESAYLPNMATNWGNSMFEGCSKLTDVNIDACVTLPQSTFRYCESLQIIDLPNCTRLNNTAFDGCYSLETVILRSPTVCAINHVNALQSTPLRGYGGTYSGHVYVPSALLETYKTTTNWSTLYASYPNIFETIEGSIYE